jgi:REP element-mobilizing transposase RayT
MARPYRLQGEDCFYHITSRGDDRKKIFINDRDFEKFLEYILTAKERFKFYIYSYCLMSNHYHLLLETQQANISKIMHYLNGSYTTYYNIKRKRCGHVFQGRYKSIVVDRDSYFLELSRYIHLNPVRAKMIKLPDEYRWSSYNGYLGEKNSVLDYDKIKQVLGMSKENYRRFVLDGLDNTGNPFKGVYGGFLLGSTKFIKEQLKNLRNQVEGGNLSYRNDIERDVEMKEIVKEVGNRYDIDQEDIYASKKKPILAKKVAIYLAKKLTALKNAEIGEQFDLTYSAVSKATADIERSITNDKKMKCEIDKLISHFKA